jgi:outer membrane protein OmpA-like peptidoglycan-associated protein
MTLTITGDADQRGSQSLNDALAENRARAVAHELTARGVSDAQLHVVS